MKMKPFCILFPLLFGLFLAKAEMVTLQGKIIDSLTKEGIPYANIGMPKFSIGTSSNENGDFIVKISKDYLNDTLFVSSVGYQTYKVSIKDILDKSNMIIVLKVNIVELNEFVVKSLDARDIVKQVLKKRAVNYNDEPVLMQAFCREIVKEKNESHYFVHTEGVVEVYKSSVKINDDHVRLLRGRKKLLSPFFIKNNKKYFLPSIANGPYTPIILDVLKNRNLFLHSHRHFNFHHESYTTINDRVVFVIHFEPYSSSTNEPQPYDADFYQGKIYVDTSTYALIRAEFESSEKGENVVNKDYEGGESPIKLDNRVFTINYTEYNNKWHFKSANVVNHYTYRDNLLALTHQVEFLVTEIHTENVKRFPQKERIKEHESLGENIETFDDSFWNDYNFIKSNEKK